MSTQHPDESATRSRVPAWVVLPLALAAIAGLVAVVVVGRDLAAAPPLPGRPQADGLTGLVSLVSELTARLAGGVALGALASITFFVRPDAGSTLSNQGRRLARTAGRAGQVWLWAALLQTCANPAYVTGVPLAYTLSPRSWWDFLSATPSGLAWLLSAAVALVVVVISFASRATAPFTLTLIAAAAANLFVAATGNVTIGADHDWATDASVWLSVASTGIVALASAVLLTGLAGGPDAVGRRVGRYQRILPWLVPPAALGLAVIAWQQLAGQPIVGVPYGQFVLAQCSTLAVLALAWAVRQATGRRSLASVLPDGLLVVAWLTLTTIENHVPTPRFGIPQSAQINYLGYDAPPAVTLARLFGLGRPNWLWISLSLAAIAVYLWGVWAVRRQGRRWSPGRTIPWVAGWALMLWLAVTGFWEYSTVVYSWHMFVHMTVNMLVPVLCVLGGPLTLLRAASSDRTRDLPGLAEVADTIATDRPFRTLFSPPALWLNYVGSLFLIYYTPLFPWLMRYHWAHQLMLLYFMATGYAFFNLIVGVDKQLHDLPHLVRLALVISIMPFHALFAVGIMSNKSLIGADFYRAIAVPWVTDLMADQNTAGQITWILGEIPLFVVMIALAAQWFAHDRAENAVSDVAQDTGVDDSFDAYNDMLAALADRDRQAARKKYL